MIDDAATPTVLETYNYDAFGNAIGFDASQALTTILYAGESRDRATDADYLRSRYYYAEIGRFTRIDEFAGRIDDPISLHKYLYTGGDPVNGIDPTGLFASAVGATTGVSLSISLEATVVLNVALIVNVQRLIYPHPEYTRLATDLDTDVITATDVDTERRRNPGYVYFAHGTSSGVWSGTASDIDPMVGRTDLDFGRGFYTTLATTEGIAQTAQLALRAAEMSGGLSFILIVRIQQGAWNYLSKKSYGTRYSPSPDYLPDVNAFRSEARQPPITGFDVASGAVAKRTNIGPWTWVANPLYPEQYKFETIAGTSKLEPVGIVPVFGLQLA